MTPVAVIQLGYLGLDVRDPGAWAGFATDVLGLQPAGETDDGAWLFRLDAYQQRFTLAEGSTDDLAFVGWEVPDGQALARFGRQLTDAGVAVQNAPLALAEARRVLGLIRFQDPEGLWCEAYHGPLMARTPFQSPRPPSGFTAGALGLGHIVLGVEDARRTVAFYRDLLGMRISDFIRYRRAPGADPRTLAFLRCNPRHHSLAVAPAGGGRRLQHFMLELNALDDVGATLDLCRARGVPVAQELGRHTNDHMLSFYPVTPSGFEVEYGWGGLTVGEDWSQRSYDAASLWGHNRPAPAAG